MWVFYTVDNEDISNGHQMKTGFSADAPDRIAEQAAEHFYYKHNGLDCGWPMTFYVWKEDGVSLGKFVVDVKSVPRFIAHTV